jgi:dinuclear metal center YbgI/SA1388 family protein
MSIKEIIEYLEHIAPPALQAAYDNCGLITGNAAWHCTGAILCMDATEPVIEEAIKNNYNLVIAHHPIIFGGLKKINGANYIEKVIITAIKNDIAIYAIHTNLDFVKTGVNGMIARKLELTNLQQLTPQKATLKKLFTFVPVASAEAVRNAVFAAGGGIIGGYSECSFNIEGTGTFKAGNYTNPYVGEKGLQHQEKEIKIELTFPSYLEKIIVKALLQAHPYEEVAYDIIALENAHPGIGSGLVGNLSSPMDEKDFLQYIKDKFKAAVIRHTQLIDKPITKVAVCGGSGSSLIFNALNCGAHFFVTADVKYHEFFDANNRMVIADIGHYESEQYTIDLIEEILQEKFPTFATLKTSVNTNPVQYFL